MVTWYWSADSLIWQVSIGHNMMSYIKKVHGKPGVHVSVNLLWPPCWATPPSPPTCARAHEKYRWPRKHEKINSWVSFISLYGYGAPLGGPSAAGAQLWHGLLCTSLTLDIHVMINWHVPKQGIRWLPSRDHIAGSSLYKGVSFWLIRSLVDPALAVFIVCGPLQLVTKVCSSSRSGVFLSWPLTKCWLTCWKQGRIVWKAVNANPGLKGKTEL